MRSEFTFKEIKNLPYTKVIWNGKVVFNDEWENGDYEYYSEAKYYILHSGPEGVKLLEEKYGDKAIYSMYMRVVDFHHCELYIEGER